MSNSEKISGSGYEAFNTQGLAEHGLEHQEKLKNERERSAEKSRETDITEARHEALEKASAIEKNHSRKKQSIESSPAERRGPSKRDKQLSYDTTMHEVRSHMSAPSRAFSSFIHNPAIEKISDAVGATVARPNAILSGSLLAFLLTLGIYLLARMNGYQLSGTETIAAFVFGWILGVIYDFLKVMITGRR